ncbi:unnamed protein product [Ilex paraguariensis]|uniref:Pentatricopeptide repeat-containing protein n=1 Tax=Ilex paraguariensis TaxID=185542 RepID=A0ABC8RSG2_9AQUA
MHLSALFGHLAGGIMKWNHRRFGYLCNCSHVISGCPHFLCLLIITRSITNPPQFENPQPILVDSFNGSAKKMLPIEIFHAEVIKNGYIQHLYAYNHILNFYIKDQELTNAQKLFDEILQRDVRSWTMLISGFVRNGFYRKSLNLLTQMEKEGVSPNEFTFSSVLKCCSNLKELRIGKVIHGRIICYGTALDIALLNSILDFYMKCGAFDFGERLFELMFDKDTVSWNIMMGAYLGMGDIEKSIDLFRILPNKNVSSWNTLVDGLLRNGYGRIALQLLYQMVNIGPAFNHVTFSIALVLVSSLKLLELGRQIHGRALRVGIHEDGFVRTSLIDVYCKCGQMEKASAIFQNLPLHMTTPHNFKIMCDDSEAESISLSSLIAGYVRKGMAEDALKIFRSLVREQVELGTYTLTSIVIASANAGLLELGQQIHACILKFGHIPDVFLSSSMIDMYAKCGKLDDAWSFFSKTNSRNIVLWTSIITSCALHGQAREAIQLFELMLSEGITPNKVSFVGVLTACSHAGLLEEGCVYFRLMKEVYGIEPEIEHYTCVVDLFARAGCLDEIKDFIQKSSLSHPSAVWKALLSSCQIHKNMDIARWASEKLLELDPSEAGPYVLLSNTCAANHRWSEAAKLRGLMQERGIKKGPGQSWIQLKNETHTCHVR